MKKLAILSLLAASLSASAGVTSFINYDYDKANDGQGPWTSTHEAHIGGAMSTALGTFDAAGVYRQLVTKSRDDNAGFEVGYSNGLNFGPVAVTARGAYGQINFVNVRLGQIQGNSSYASVGAEAAYKFNDRFTGFVGARMRHGLNADTISVSNRITVGTDIKTNDPRATMRIGYSFTKQDGKVFNGATTAFTYAY